MYDGFSFDIVKESPLMGNGFFTDSGETGILYGRTGRPTGERWRYVTDNYRKTETEGNRYIGERTVLYAGGTAVGVKSGGRSHYLGSDIQGSVKNTTSDEGYVENEYSYDIFGTVISGSFTNGVDFAYCGKIYDPVTGNLNYGFRDYSPSISRFTTVDPVRDGTNWFAYCAGDSVNYVDLWGLTASESTINGSLVEKLTGLSITEQLDYLHSVVEKDYGSNLQAKADAAKELRSLFNSGSVFDLEGLFYGSCGSEYFMNEPLRDFLNTSDNGQDYVLKDIENDTAWKKIFFLGTLEHQNGVKLFSWNVKYVSTDGREVIFDIKGKEVKYGINRGTYNYGTPSAAPSSNHSRYDMEPFFRQYQKFPWYRAYISKFKEYNINGGDEEITWKF